MKPGPLRQAVGALGLMALLPTAWLLAAGALEPWQAAVRALATLAGVTVVGRLAAWWLASAARAIEQGGRPTGAGPAGPQRRRTDGPTPARPDGADDRRGGERGHSPAPRHRSGQAGAGDDAVTQTAPASA